MFTNAVNPFIINQFETQGGLFPFPQRSYDASVRLDHRVDDSNQLAFRYSYAHDNEQNPNLQALTAYSRGTRVNAWDSTAMGSWYHQFSPTTQNEAHVQWAWSYLGVDTTDPGGPGLDIEGYGFFGRQIFLPKFYDHAAVRVCGQRDVRPWTPYDQDRILRIDPREQHNVGDVLRGPV